MHVYRLFWLVCVLCYAPQLHAQTVRLYGKIQDRKTQEPLVGAVIGIPSLQIGSSTNETGTFQLLLQAGKYDFRVSFVGYRDSLFTLSLMQDLNLDLWLASTETNLGEVVVTANKDDAMNKVNRNAMSVDRLTAKEAKLLPAIFGEIDIIKVLQLKPGVKSGGEGNAGFYVRGGGTDQNLILVDKAPVYNPNHLFGFFSVFNSDAVQEVELYKAGFPARYGGRLSSVLDVQMRSGDYKDWGVEGGIGLISSRLTVRTPLLKNKATLTLSGRRTYVDVFTRMVNQAKKNDPSFDKIPDYFFYDGNVRFDYLIGKKDNISLTGYYGDDFFKFSGDSFGAKFAWGNRSATLAWRHNFTPKVSMTNSYYLSGYNYRISNQFGENVFSLGSGIVDQGFAQDWEYNPNIQHQIQFGFTGIYHRFTVGKFSFSTDFTSLAIGQLIEGVEGAAYLSDNIKFSSKLELLAGVRLSNFFARNKTYSNLEPRTALNYKVSKNTAIKASYARMYQYLHLISLSNASLPTDIWYPSTTNVKPQSSDQIALGWHQALNKERFFFSLESYYKWLYNAVDFREGARIFANPKLEQEFIRGKGWAYGIEAYLEKKQGKTTGWVGYTLSWSWRSFQELNNGKAFHPRYDRRHDISVVIMHKVSPRVHISGTWVFGTGNYVSLATGRYAFQDFAENKDLTTAPIFLNRNDYQMPPTHRLDLGLVWKQKPKKPNRESDFTFSIYNAYSRRNPFFIYYEEKRDQNNIPTEFVPKMVSLFPILPSVTYNFKF